MIEYRIAELLKLAGVQLSHFSERISDGRIQSTPDIRTVRYYQAQGLISKPHRYEGREAIYGALHLQQLVIIKALQIEGYKLRQIQKRLAGVLPSELNELYQKLGFEDENHSSESTPSTVRQLVTVELQTGVILTIDPQIITHPNNLIAHLTSALNQWSKP